MKSFSQIWKANEIPSKPIDWADIDYDIDFWHCIYEWCVNIVLGWLTVLLAGDHILICAWSAKTTMFDLVRTVTLLLRRSLSSSIVNLRSFHQSKRTYYWCFLTLTWAHFSKVQYSYSAYQKEELVFSIAEILLCNFWI